MIWDVDPVLVELGPLEIRYYGVFFALSLYAAYSLARFMVKRKGLNLELLDRLAVYLIIGLIVGARLGHILFYELDYYLANPLQIIKVWEGGLASHGATIGLLLAYGLFLWKNKKVGLWDYADILAVVATLPVSWIRLGNFFNSELVGRSTDAPWGVVFSRVDELTRHPSQLYEFAMGSLLFALLFPLWMKKHKEVRPGFFFGLFFILYFMLRFSVEFFKDFPLHEGFFNLTTGQILSLPFFLLGWVVLLYTHGKKRLK